MLTYSDASQVNGTLLQAAKWRRIIIVISGRYLLHVVGGKPQLDFTAVIPSPPAATQSLPYS